MPRSSATVVDQISPADGCDLDLRRDYQNAVDCLIQCDALFKTMQEQLRSKDSQIAALEDKVMELSLELASVKACQDYQKLRTSQGSSSNNVTKSVATLHPSCERRMSWTSCWTSSSENSNSSSSNNNAFNLGKFMNKTLSLLAESRHPATTTTTADSNNNDIKSHAQYQSCLKHKNGNGINCRSPLPQSLDDKTSSRPWHHLERSEPPRHRQLHRSPSSKKCIEALNDVEGVIFPVSSFEVYSKGCCSSRVEDRIITNYGTAPEIDSMKNVEWPTLG